MGPDDTVDRTIRNHRYRGWPGWAWAGAFAFLWLPAIYVLDRLTPREWLPYAIAGTFLLEAITGALSLWHLEHRPAHRIKLGDELRAYDIPRGRHAPANIAVIRFTNDGDGDYIEDDLPVPLCRVTVEPRRGRRVWLVASTADASRLREWAGQHGVAVEDPHGLSSLKATSEPRA